MTDIALRRNALSWSLAKAQEAIARGGLRQNEIDRRTRQIAACRRALSALDNEKTAAEKLARLKEMERLRDVEHLSLQAIGDRLGISKQRVGQLMGKVGQRSLTPNQSDILALRDEGRSIQEIADLKGRSYMAIWGVLNRIGALDKRAYQKKEK